MRIFIAIFVISLIALATDYYIYKRVMRRYRPGNWWRVGYLVYAFVVDTAVVSALLTYRYVADFETTLWMRSTLWVIGLFFLHFVPKFVYVVLSLGDYAVSRFTRNRSHIFGYLGAFAGWITVVVMVWGLTYGRSRIEVREVELTFESLPESFDGLRVVQFSDNHIGTLVHRDRFLDRMVDTINTLKPDLVIQSGDIVNTHARELDGGARDIFGRIESRYGVYSVLGNHDLGIYIRDTVAHSPSGNVELLKKLQLSMGWHLLVNQTAYINNGIDSISVSGLNYPSGYRNNGHVSEMTGVDLGATYDGVPPGVFNITVSHAPQLWDEVMEEFGPELTLAGHVHAMQMKLRIGEWQWSPARFLYRQWSGLYGSAGHYLYINDGAGYVMFPMRIGTRPEITLFTLRSAKN